MRRFIRDVVLPVAVAVALAFIIQAAVAKPYEIPTESMVPTIQANDRIIANRVIYRFRDVERRDIVVFDPPASVAADCGAAGGGNIPYVKRVIGLPGDTVEVRRFTVAAGDRPAMARVRSGVVDGRASSAGFGTLSDVRVDTVALRPGDSYAITYVNGAPFPVTEAITPVDLQGPPAAYGLAGRTIVSEAIYRVAPTKVPADHIFVLGDNRPDSCDSHQWSDPFVPLGNVIGQAEVIYWPLPHVTFLD